jgi:hypothetical protein
MMKPLFALLSTDRSSQHATFSLSPDDRERIDASASSDLRY